MDGKSRYLETRDGRARRAVWVALAVILAAQAAVLLYFAYLRQGFHVDELLTFFLANNSASAAPYPKDQPDYVGQWHDAQYFRDFLTCQPSEVFRFGFVYENQKADVLGPLYFLLLHLACSFAPDGFSKWIVVAAHLLLFLLCGVLLWQMGRRLLKSDWAALLPVILWGFSAGAASSTLYFRVYPLLMLFLVLITFLAFRVAESPRVRWPLAAAVALTVAGGFLTHYYFVLYTLFLGLALGVFLLLRRRFADLGRSLLAVGAGAGLGVLIFPFSMDQAFTSYRGRGAWEQIASGGPRWGETLAAYGAALRDQLFGGTAVLVAVAVVLAAGGVFLLCRRLRRPRGRLPGDTGCRAAKLLMLGAAVAGYTLTVAVVAPYSAARYVYPVFPLVLFAVAALLWLLLQTLWRSRRARAVCFAAVCLFALCIGSLGLGRQQVENLLPAELKSTYTSTVDPEGGAAKNAGAYCMVVYPEQFVDFTYFLYPEFFHYQKICLLHDDQTDRLAALAADIPRDTPVVVYVKLTKPAEEQVKELGAALGRTEAEHLFDSRVFAVYRFT